MAYRDIDEPHHAFRLLDVSEEPQGLLPSIEGYESTPLVSFEEAVAPLIPIIPNVERMIQMVKSNCRESDNGLTRDESISIMLYSLEWQPKQNSFFCILNKALRSANRQQLRPWFLYLRLILTAFSHLPSTCLTLYRGSNMDLTIKYPTGKTVVWWGFSSCMKRSNKLEKKLFLNKTGPRTLFIIDCYSGKDIHRHSVHSVEGEILLPPGCQFQVVSSVDKGHGLHTIELKEIQSEYDYLHMYALSTNPSPTVPVRNIHFQPISAVSLSKKSLPAALPNLELEARIAYFQRRTKIDLGASNLTDSDIDIVVSEIIIKRQCPELHLPGNKFTHNGVLILAQALRNNKIITSNAI